jgi:Taurine catabolism dioxygenase TauD, TfdA family
MGSPRVTTSALSRRRALQLFGFAGGAALLGPALAGCGSSSGGDALAGNAPLSGKFEGLPFLLAHASSPNYAVDFGWKAGDFVVWDNQASWHFAVNDDVGPRAYRKVIGG